MSNVLYMLFSTFYLINTPLIEIVRNFLKKVRNEKRKNILKQIQFVQMVIFEDIGSISCTVEARAARQIESN